MFIKLRDLEVYIGVVLIEPSLLHRQCDAGPAAAGVELRLWVLTQSLH